MITKMRPETMIKFHFKRHLLILFFFLFNTNSVLAEGKITVIKVGVFQLAPLVYIDKNDSSQGVFVDVIEAIARKENWKVEYIKGTWSEGLDKVKNNQIDLMTAVMHLSRRESFLDFPKESVFNIWGQLYIHKDANILGIFDMEGKTVGVLKGGANGENFIELLGELGIHCKTIAFDSQEDTAEAINEKRVDAGVFTNVHGYKYQQSHQLKKTQIVFDPSYLKYATAKGANQQLLLTIDTYLSKWKRDQNSVYYAIIEKHLGIPESKKIPDWVWAIIIIGVSIIGVILLAVSLLVVFNKKLKSEVKASTQNLVVELDRRKTTEKKLRKNEERYRTIIQTAMNGFWLTDIKGNFLEVNDAYAQMSGHSTEELLSMQISDIEANENPEIVAEHIQKGIEIGSDRFETVHRRKDFSTFDVEVSFCYLPIEGGRFVVFLKDITERNQAEGKLRERESFIRTIMDNLPIGVAVNSVDPTVEFDYMNNNFPKFYRTNREAFDDPDGFWNSVYEDSTFREKIKKRILDDCASGDPERMHWEDVPIIRKGEETVFINAKNIPLPDKRLMISTVWDVTERKLAEEALQRSESKYRRLSENSPAIVYQFRMTPDGEFTFPFVNNAVKSIMGVAAEDVMRDSSMLLGMVHPEDQKMFLEGILKSAESLKLYNAIFRYLKNGEERWIEARSTPDTMEDGSILWDGFLVDITERKKLESQLQQAQKMESVGTLAGGIAHDFNNILFPIIGHSEMLLEDIPEDSPFKDSLNEIYTSSLRASELVKQILTFSRQDSNVLKLMKMQPIIKEALKLIRSSIPTTIEIKQNLQSDCGAIKADPTQIHQIIMNLCTNAYHAMEDTGGKLIVSLKEIELGQHDVSTPKMIPGAYACLTISDTGIGMDKSLMETIFDPFFTTKEQGKGTGMGLSVVHGIIKSTGGAIQVYSEPGKGTEFKVYLPVVKSSFEQQESHQIKDPIQGGSERILLVDDEEAVVTMEKLMLERLGYQVTSHTSSIDTLETFRTIPDRFDLVITDMAMPNMSGDKLAVELTKIRPDIPVLLCTGFSETMSVEKATSLGIKGFLLKPIVMKDLSLKIREVLDKN